ncbi:CAP domain-containing protein [Halogranum gelatinilyticum]|uniref:CAP domain-containing protein n=1 Tax=Halogranum gelatinilyticum TaxID=660521 RepID=UPI00244EE135|nr:CAP domain-containing protein [Halogranum gelatinilyticum]
MHAEVNEVRAANGLSELGYDDTVASVSRAHSEDMDAREYFSHTNPDGERPWDRYADVADSTCSAYGENIAQNWVGVTVRTDDGSERYETSEEIAAAIVEQWMNSDGHRANILSTSYETEGLGVYITAEGKVYVTQNFCG